MLCGFGRKITVSLFLQGCQHGFSRLLRHGIRFCPDIIRADLLGDVLKRGSLRFFPVGRKDYGVSLWCLDQGAEFAFFQTESNIEKGGL